jgi:hypothetical protein
MKCGSKLRCAGVTEKGCVSLVFPCQWFKKKHYCVIAYSEDFVFFGKHLLFAFLSLLFDSAMHTLSSATSKEVLMEALVELMNTRREEFGALVLDAMEQVALAAAIQEGRTNDFVSEEEIMALLTDAEQA